MSFLGDLGKAFLGKPLGLTSSKQVVLPGQIPPALAIPTQGNRLLDDRGLKVIPKILIERLRSHRQVDRLTVTAWIRNLSDLPIRVKSISILKQPNTFNQILGPHESRQLTLYNGAAPHNENEHQARINYRLQLNRDMFQATYRIGYHYDSDGTREINQLYPDGPIRTYW